MTGVNTPLVSTATRTGLSVFRVDPSQTSCQTRAGFTLIELLVVISIIGILSSALVVSVKSGYKQARQANCKSNLRQFGVALTIYRGEHDNRTPDWLSNLYPEYVDDRAMYVCRADKNNGRDRPRPIELIDHPKFKCRNELDSPPFWDNEKNSDSKRNNDQGSSGSVKACSYLFEFSVTPPPGWSAANGVVRSSMRDYKIDQMTYGDSSSGTDAFSKPLPYSASRIPIVRCYHHWKDNFVYGRGGPGQAISRQPITINVAYAGNVFVGPPWWEGTIHPGETAK